MAGFTYYSGDFDTRLSFRWIDSVVNNMIEYGWVFGAQDVDWGNAYVKSMTYFDLSAGYQFGDRVGVRFNIDNVTDEDPPIHVHNWCCNTDPAYYDYFGRSYGLSLSMQF